MNILPLFAESGMPLPLTRQYVSISKLMKNTNDDVRCILNHSSAFKLFYKFFLTLIDTLNLSRQHIYFHPSKISQIHIIFNPV